MIFDRLFPSFPEMERALSFLDWRMKPAVLLDSGLVLSLACVALALYFKPLMGLDDSAFPFILAFAASAPLAAAYQLPSYLAGLKIARMEEETPSLLVQAASLPLGTPVTEFVKSLSESSTGPLAQEFRTAWKQMKAGASFPKALHGIMDRADSKVIRRALNLLVQGYHSGADMGSAFREAAEDLFDTQSLFKERRAALTVETYTLLAASALIVPALLAVSVNVVDSLDLEELSYALTGSREASGLRDAALAGNSFYLAFFASMSALFVALQEGRPRKALFYAIALIPTAFTVYSLVRNAPLF